MIDTLTTPPIKKLISSIVTLAILITSAGVFPNASYAFSDVTSINTYYKAITYLSSQGIIQGYVDGTFQPDKIVSRVEFLKLVLMSSGIQGQTYGTSGFPDVDESQWYAPYIRKAESEGWIQGYPDGTFRPGNAINKAEALKILGLVQQWKTKDVITEQPYLDIPKLSWYTPYIDYAKSRNYLEETGKYFIPDAAMSRGKISEILYRIEVTSQNNADAYSSNLRPTINGTVTQTVPIPVTADTTPAFTPVAYSSVAKNFFTNVSLEEDFPNNFYLDEVYNFKGTILNGTYQKAFVFIADQNDTTNQSFQNYVANVTGKTFSIPVIFRQPGNYRLGIILGDSGESKVVNISVLPNLPAEGTLINSTPATGPNISYKNNTTTLTWNAPAQELVKLKVYQGNAIQSFVFRQGTNSFNIDFADFKNFQEGNVNYVLESARMKSSAPLELSSGWSTDKTKSFTAGTHYFSSNDTDSISVNVFPETLSKISPIHFTGTAKTNIYQEAVITKPDGSVETLNLSSSKPTQTYYGSEVIPKGNDYTYHYVPVTKGVYFVEINSQEGSAVINTPVYVNDGIPLLPDFFDLNKNTQPEKGKDLITMRTELLADINAARVKQGLQSIKIDSTLNNLSQLHSEDMVNNNYFGHINLAGETPNDRRLKLNIPTPVGENLAEAPTVAYTHEGLMRSGIHRKNILDPKWTRVGIGIAINSSGELVTTEEFSSDPYTSIDLLNMKGDMINAINKARSDLKISLIEPDSILEPVATDWSTLMVTENFFDFTSPNGESLANNVQKASPTRAVQAVILESSDADKLEQEIVAGKDATTNQWAKLGLGLKVDNKGTLKATLLYTTH